MKSSINCAYTVKMWFSSIVSTDYILEWISILEPVVLTWIYEHRPTRQENTMHNSWFVFGIQVMYNIVSNRHNQKFGGMLANFGIYGKI